MVNQKDSTGKLTNGTTDHFIHERFGAPHFGCENMKESQSGRKEKKMLFTRIQKKLDYARHIIFTQIFGMGKDRDREKARERFQRR